MYSAWVEISLLNYDLRSTLIKIIFCYYIVISYIGLNIVLPGSLRAM